MDYAKQFLNKVVTVEIDRPLGTKHPKHNLIYTLNYGYIDGVKAPDGEYVDAYVLGVFKPLKRFTGKCIAIVHRTNDEDDKLVVVPEGALYSNKQIIALTKFQERFFKSKILRK